MKRRYLHILGVVAAVAVLALAIWGYREYRMKNLIGIHAENHYQQAFHELTYYVDSLEESLNASLAMQSRESMRPQLAETWRLSALAHASANALPLTLLPFNRTNEFLAHVGEFTYNTGVKTTNDRPLSSDEYRTLEKLYRESHTIREELRDLQNTVMTRHLRWMDVEWALRSKKGNQDNQVIDGIRRVDGYASDYTQSFSPENPRNAILEKKKIRPLSGAPINKKQAAQRLKKWLGLRSAATRRIGETGKGSNAAAYLVTLKPKQNRTVSAAIGKKGGQVLWYLSNRSPGSEKIGLYDATRRAAAFLKARGLTDLQLTKRDQYRNTAVLTYVTLKDHIRVYPASVRIKVALDNGEVVAFDQTERLLFNGDGINTKPRLSAAAARRQLNHDLKVHETDLAVFQNDALKNVLCYEMIATRGDSTYRLLVNANDGNQEKIELLRN